MAIKGRRTIRRRSLGSEPSKHVGIWDIEAPTGSTLAKLEAAYLAGLAAVDAVEDRKAASAASNKFTPEGVRDDVLRFALNTAVPSLKGAHNAIVQAKAELAERRSKLQLATPDKADLDGALLRHEIRTHLKAMPQVERDHYVRDIEKLPPIVAETIVTAPSFLTGVAETHRALLMEKALEAQHPGEAAAAAELSRAIEMAERAVEIGRDEVRIEAGVMDPAKFNELAAPVEAKHAAPWLKKLDENGTEVVRKMVWYPDKGNGAWVKPSPEDLDRGVFYRTWDEYKAANPHWDQAA